MMRSIDFRHDHATPSRPHPPTDEKLPLWQCALITIGADLVLWAAIIAIGLAVWSAL